jgi:hypothetical protein
MPSFDVSGCPGSVVFPRLCRHDTPSENAQDSRHGRLDDSVLASEIAWMTVLIRVSVYKNLLT